MFSYTIFSKSYGDTKNARQILVLAIRRNYKYVPKTTAACKVWWKNGEIECDM